MPSDLSFPNTTLYVEYTCCIINIGQVWCGIIADGVHTHPTSIRIAYKTNFKSLVLVTDAILAMGYKDGKYQFGQQEIEVRGDQAWVAGTSTLTGSVATMQRSVTKFLKYVAKGLFTS